MVGVVQRFAPSCETCRVCHCADLSYAEKSYTQAVGKYIRNYTDDKIEVWFVEHIVKVLY